MNTSTGDIALLYSEIEKFSISSPDDLENFRLKFLVKKGIIPSLLSEIKNIAPENRRDYGESVNKLKTLAESKFKTAGEEIINKQSVASDTLLDLSLPGPEMPLGSIHPVTLIRNRIIEIFSHIGFTVSYGPEIEDDWHNFTALNMGENHPARDMQDTFFIQKNPDILLRTHTSNVQIRVMENQKPPIRTLSPGRTFRNEAISARAHCMFHQVEGLYIDEGVSFSDLKQTLQYFVHEMFGKEISMRLRASYFPFTEPSAEVDITCLICKSKGCNVCKHSGWVEIMGAGMVDPAVLENGKIDSEKFTGFAFGMGIERIAMLKYQINDLRLFQENDLRFLRQWVGG